MTLPPPVYDLVLLLDPKAEDAARAKIVADVEQAIRDSGELLRHDSWGDRALAYPIKHQTDAEYHLLQFHGTPELLQGLNHTLHITDGVVRFRVIKLKPGTPDAPDLRAARREAEPAAAAAAPAPAAVPAPVEAPPAESPAA
jgi:small subunit ribosomal protein S6